MLSAIRNKSKGWVAYLIVGLITVPFALFGIQDYVSRSANNSIATVDGEDIDINEEELDGKAVRFVTAWNTDRNDINNILDKLSQKYG